MSASHATLPRAADARYEGGFDRWNCHARAGWALLWRASEHGLFVLGEGRSVWRWDSRDTIWSRIPQSDAAVILQEHDQAMARLRRALPVIRLYEKLEAGPEREAARLALQRIGVAIVDMWQEARLSDGLPRGVGWFDSPAAVYRAVTRDACMHLQAAGRSPFDAEIYAELVAGDQEDLRAGRRQQIPRMRPLDMADVPRESGAPAWQRPDQNPFLYPGPARARRRAEPPAQVRSGHEAWNAYMDVLRTDIQRDTSRMELAESTRRRRRRRLARYGGGMCGLLTAALLVAFAMGAVG